MKVITPHFPRPWHISRRTALDSPFSGPAICYTTAASHETIATRAEYRKWKMRHPRSVARRRCDTPELSQTRAAIR